MQSQIKFQESVTSVLSHLALSYCQSMLDSDITSCWNGKFIRELFPNLSIYLNSFYTRCRCLFS